MNIGLGSDHAGFLYKERIKAALSEAGHNVVDFGAHSEAVVDYPTFIRPVALAVAKGDVEKAVIFGGSGNGEAIVANRVPGVRCAVCWNMETARLAAQHNDANIISLGQRVVSLDTALRIVHTWLTTAFEGGRHVNRLHLIDHPEDA